MRPLCARQGKPPCRAQRGLFLSPKARLFDRPLRRGRFLRGRAREGQAAPSRTWKEVRPGPCPCEKNGSGRSWPDALAPLPAGRTCKTPCARPLTTFVRWGAVSATTALSVCATHPAATLTLL